MILIVEDDDATRDLYREILRRAGFACVGTGAPDQALRWAYNENFDAVILDVGLPRVTDGLRLAAQLRALPIPPPIIAVTGHRLEYRARISFAETLQKPTDVAAIVRAVERYAVGQLALRF